MRAALVGTTILGLVLVTGCSSSTTSEPSPSATPAASAGAVANLPPLVGTPWVLPSPSSTADAAYIWCTALNQAVTTVSGAGTTRAGAQKKMDALVSYAELWDLAVGYGYVTSKEADVNKQFLSGYEQMVQLEAAGKAPNDKDVVDLTAAINKLTTDSQSLFDSSATKITALCGGSGSPTPSPTN